MLDAALPQAWDALDAAQAGTTLNKDVLRGCKRVVVIGVHGWFPGIPTAFGMCFPSFADPEMVELRFRDTCWVSP